MNWKDDSPFSLIDPQRTALPLRLAARGLERALGLTALRRVYESRPAGSAGIEVFRASLDTLGVRVSIDPADLARIPRSGALVVVSNHPFGAVEGMALAVTLARCRPDVRVLGNFLLARIPALREALVAVDPFAADGSRARNVMPLARARRWLGQGGVLLAFPAGEVAHLDLRRGRVGDPVWNPTVAGLARLAGCPILPAFVPGRNGAWFQALGLLHPRLRTLLLPRALLACRGRAIELRLGNPIPGAALAAFGSDREAIDHARGRTQVLRARPQTAAAAVQPRRTPAGARAVVPADPPALLAAEVAALPAEQRLVEAGDLAVLVAEADQIPRLLREIGRQRELTFREAGEGTGRELDLDDFDRHYQHLFVWSAQARSLVGSYRVGRTDTLVAARGCRALYTSTLFDYRPALFRHLGPALELGRSFVRVEHQRSYAPLLLLWKGIGRLVLREPRYATLFGPVSISADYASASQRLIVSFLEQNRYVHEAARWVRPRTPWRPPRGVGNSDLLGPARLSDLEDVSTFIAEIEADGKGVPILLRQYLKLGGRLLGFNVDPDFANVLDVLILVDLRRTEPKILERYMGRDEAAAFRAHHDDPRSAAS